MAKNEGKAWQDIVKRDFKKVMKVIRLYDTTNGFLNVRNPADFIGYKYPNMFLMEAKTIHGNTLPMSNIPQKDDLYEYIEVEGIKAGLIIWYVDHALCVWVPINVVKTADFTGDKSLNVKTILDKGGIQLPIVIKRKYPEILTSEIDFKTF